MKTSMIKRTVLAAALAAGLCGCGTVAEHLMDAMEPRLEKIVDAQIEREERIAGIWGTTNSYFHVTAQAKEEVKQAEREEVLVAAMELLEENRAEILERLNAVLDERFGVAIPKKAKK